MAHKVGSKIWYKGDEVTITTNPYKIYGGMFQDAEKEDGTIVNLATPEQVQENVKQLQKDNRDMQDGFRKLRENS